MTTQEKALAGQAGASIGSSSSAESPYPDQSKHASPKLAFLHIVGSWQSGRDEVQVHLDFFAEWHRIDIRTWYTDPASKVKAGKGLSLPMEQLDQLATAVNVAAELAQASLGPRR